MRHQRKSYRAAVLWAAGSFVAIQAGLSMAMERWVPKIRDPESTVKLHALKSAIAAAPHRPLVVLLGSSKVGVNLRPQCLPPWSDVSNQPIVFNCALCRSEPVMEYLMLRRLLDTGMRPDWALIELTPELFNEYCNWGEQVQPPRLSRRELRWLAPYSSQPDQMRQAWVDARACPTYEYRFTFLSQLVPSLLPRNLEFFASDWRGLDNDGWLNIPRFEDQGAPAYHNLLTEFVRGTYSRGFAHFRPIAREDVALHDLIGYCGRKGIRVVLLRMPDLFRHDYSPQARAELDEYVGRISRESAAPVWDMRDWVADDGFYDGVHLIHPNVVSFSERFGRELLWPLLARDSQRRELSAAAARRRAPADRDF